MATKKVLFSRQYNSIRRTLRCRKDCHFIHGASLMVCSCKPKLTVNLALQLLYRQTLQTHASLQTNTSTVSLPDGKAVSCADIPGHPRIRDQFRDHLPDAKAVVFVVDSNTVSRNGPAVAEYAFSPDYWQLSRLLFSSGIFTRYCML